MQSSSTEKERKIKFIDSLWVFLVATATLGPFALPLLWKNPRYSKKTKMAGTFAVILFTGVLVWISKVGITELNRVLEETNP